MSYFVFENPIFLEVSGADAERYLNARLSNDLNLLSSNRAIQAAILTAQGKTQGFFTILKLESSYLLYCTGGTATEVKDAFSQFIVADRIVVAIRADLSLLYSEHTGSEGNFLDCTKDAHQTLIQSNRLGQNGWDIITPTDEHTLVTEKMNECGFSQLSVQEFELARIKNGTLSFPQELNENSLFAEAELAHAVSFSKGCYVGQEALEMLAARGKLPAQIVKLQVAAEQESLVGKTIFEDSSQNTRIGRVLSSALDTTDNVQHCLVRIKTSHAIAGTVFTEGGRPAEVTPRTIPLQQK